MATFGKSDVGMKRSSNQDSFITEALSPSDELIVVCDGMGGANGGSVASSMAAQIISERIKQSFSAAMPDRSVKNLIESAVSAANISIFDKSLSDSALAGMGTTAVAAIIRPDRAIIAHVGDSRAYIVPKDNSESEILQITTDHSIVQMLVETGQISQDEARVHPKRNIITRAIGTNDTVKVDFDLQPLYDGDKLLLCTDGLTNYVMNDVILEKIKNNSPKNAVVALIAEANKNGGGDNITAVISEFCK